MSTSAGSTAYTAGGPPVVVDPAVTFTDADTVPTFSATVTISGGYQNGDSLNFTNTANITGTVSTVNGVYTLTLTGSDTLTDYEAALASVTFSSTSASTATRTISFTVTDGTIGAAATKRSMSSLR